MYEAAKTLDDMGTIAMVVNSFPKVIKAPPGLLTMKDLPVPSAALEDIRKIYFLVLNHLLFGRLFETSN